MRNLDLIVRNFISVVHDLKSCQNLENIQNASLTNNIQNYVRLLSEREQTIIANDIVSKDMIYFFAYMITEDTVL